ncbi:MAG: hypothetical protein LKJ94_07265 [Candidatus Methanomethylophilus sp.]|jgi:glucose-6-phosphate isomerase|nr:hypothetical protein [Methanomethylophilus sp.]MCI2075470.1 hypothetical protein [Methanomethylophilus sp.]MCI2093292.1 hypothetical protein [Methanomethylophilus sp.]MEE3400601.1 hypothetical protein [Methanomethylophilus sp.]WII08838.1 hypothetical protein O8W32_06595 [Methanomassiliicoccales archaeon LGM-DZ1]
MKWNEVKKKPVLITKEEYDKIFAEWKRDVFGENAGKDGSEDPKPPASSKN